MIKFSGFMISRVVSQNPPKTYSHVKGEITSFNIGFSAKPAYGYITNTIEDAVLNSPPLIVAQMTEKTAKNANSDVTRLAETNPTQIFVFVPDSVTASKTPYIHGSTTAYVPTFRTRMNPGQTYYGYFVPLTFLPPLQFQSGLGYGYKSGVFEITAADFIYLCSNYIESRQFLNTYDDRMSNAHQIITVTGGNDANHTMMTSLINTSSYDDIASQSTSGTFDSLIHLYHDTPVLQITVVGANTFIDDTSRERLRPNIVLNTDEPEKPRWNIEELSWESKFDNHAIEMFSNDFTNHPFIPFDSVVTKKNVIEQACDSTNKFKSVYVGKEARTVAGFDFMEGGRTRVNMYLPG